jgi:hypothetical protein
MLLVIKRLIACLSVYIMSYEECDEDSFIYGIYEALNLSNIGMDEMIETYTQY